MFTNTDQLEYALNFMSKIFDLLMTFRVHKLSHTFKGMTCYVYIMILFYVLVKRHEHVCGFLCTYF